MQTELLDFIYQQWPSSDSCVPTEEIIHKAVQDNKNEGLPVTTTSPLCIRFVGQSGSGKTTQLLPAAQYALKHTRLRPIYLSVRKFARYHPHLEQIRQKQGDCLLREQTNAFALSLLTAVFEHLIQEHYPIVLEVTLLSPLYERFVHSLLQKNNYTCDYHFLAIPQRTSNAWIEARCQATQRQVSQKSAQFFYETLDPALHFLQTLFPYPNRFFIWDRTHIEPLQTTCQDAQVFAKINQARESSTEPLSPEVLLEAKKHFFKSIYGDVVFME